MPRVALNRKQYKTNDIGAWVRGQLYKEGKSFAELGEALDMSEQAVSYKLKHNSFRYADLLTVFEFLGSSDDEILYLMKIRK